MKKWTPVFLAFLIGAAAGILFVLPGFQKRTDVYLQDFSVSGDGSVVTVETFSLDGSARAMEVKQIGGELHCSFYRAFGWLNSGLGAKSRFEIRLEDSAKSAESIYFDRAYSDQLVLERDAETGEWTSASPLPQ